MNDPLSRLVPTAFKKAAAGFFATLAGGVLLAEVSIIKEDDNSHRIKGANYEAIVDAVGDLIFLSSGGKEFFTTPTPHRSWVDARKDEGALSINLTGNLLAIRNDRRIVEFTFDPTTIHVDHEGGLPWYGLAPDLTGQVKKNGDTIPAGKVAPDVVKLVNGEQAILLTEPMHTMNGLTPSKTTRGTKQNSRFQYQIETGVAVTGAEQVTVVALDGRGATPQSAPLFPKGTEPAIFAQLKNLSTNPVSIKLNFKVTDHHTRGTEVFAKAQDIHIQGLSEETMNVSLPLETPGFYSVTMELLEGDAVAKRERLWIVVQPESYRPALTRPDDFEAFWQDRLAYARSVPLNPRIVRNEAMSTEAFDYYDVELELLPGRDFKTGLLIPKDKEATVAKMVFFHAGKDPANSLIQQFKREGTPQIFVSAPMPQEGTFRHWNGATDNNLLECYLTAIRTLDFIRSYEQVKGIHVVGNSRSGPLALVAAALSPEKIIAVHSHVPTTMGVSWKDKPYSGWGQAPGGQLDAAAYVDPVNFAPDMSVPFWLDGGTNDGLSYPQGMLAFYNYAENAPWKRIAIERGGHGYFTSGNRKRFLDELSTLLEAEVSSSVDDNILREH